MHIETELDDTYAERLLQLQQHLNKPLPEVVAHIIAQALDTQNNEQSPFDKRLLALTPKQREAYAYLDKARINLGEKPMTDREEANARR